MKSMFIISFFLLLIVSCKSTTEYQNVKSAQGSQEWGPKELNVTADKMVKSLYEYLKSTGAKAFLDVSKIRNRTSEHIDTRTLINALITNLTKKRIKFVDRNSRQDAIKEIEAGQTGIISADSAIPVGELKSPNYLLNGEITDNVRSIDGDRVQYLQVTLRLTQTATTQIVWQEQQEFLKSTEEQKYSW